MKALLVGFLKIIFISLSMYFLFEIFIKNVNKINISINYIGFSILLFFSVFYAFLLSMMAWIWKIIVEDISLRKFSTKLIWIYLQTYIAKYIPGNVFHYVTRQIEMSKEGVSHAVIFKGNMVETICIIVSSLIVILLLYTNNNSLLAININNYIDSKYSYLILVFLCLLVLAIRNLKYFLYLFYYGFFFIGIGLITYSVANFVLNYNVSIVFSVFVFTASWLVGTLVPGAPGGLGVRESIFVILSENILMDYQALSLAIQLRLVTLGGEFISYLVAAFMVKRKIYKNCEEEQ